LMPREGGVPVRLTTGSGPDASPSTARDGTIAFSNSRWRNGLLVHTLATGVNRTLLTHSPFLWGPAFSPDGRELAYSQGEVDGSWHVWAVPTEGGTPRRLTSTPQGELYPRYTPDGQFILFQNWNEPRRIWQVPRAGGPPRMLPISQDPGDAYADMSPDGKWVAFVRSEAGAEHIFTAPMSGGPARRIVDEAASVPRWSPDGSLIAFSPDRGYGRGVFVVRPDGTGRRRLTERGGWPIWWPDGTQIVYLLVGADGNQIVEITPLEGGAARRLETLRFNATNHPIAVSPDATLIATSDSVHISDEIWLLRPQ
ncbi:MAG: TolB family protein, partial [bacterium]